MLRAPDHPSIPALFAAVLVGLLLPAGGFGQDAIEKGWRNTLERVSSSVVSIRIDGTRAFDTEWNTSSQATGFVVDARRGLVLTNRHVVMPGPVVAEAVFINNEEVELRPVYRDPVHDFGFYQYDPDDLRYIQPEGLVLAPDGAEIGREIRVVGNDAGEQISILAGTLARLDRQAPEYGRGRYSDFNTFYFQAASGTSGGSSGSPVIDIDGHVVALNAGANTQAASSFFLPLDRVQRALEKLQAGEPVTRGTLMTRFTYTPYDELKRLGLTATTEQTYRRRFPEATGLLVVREIVPGSPAESRLEPGDILLAVNGEPVAEFTPLAEILDGNVGRSADVLVERGGQDLTLSLDVQDLHAITPAEYFQFGDAIVHVLSYQQARHLNMPVSGIYVANPGYVLAASAIPRAAVITSVDGTPTPSLDSFIEVLGAVPNGERATLRYYTFDEPQAPRIRSITMDRMWYPAARCRRDDSTGHWPCDPLPPAAAAKPREPSSTTFPRQNDQRLATLSRSLVMVSFDMPYSVSGVSDRFYSGTGLVVDADEGLVVVDRNTVPVVMGDVSITFAGALSIPGKVVYVHPLHNVSVIAYDPALIGDTPVRSAELDLDLPDEGRAVWVVGLKGNNQLATQETRVAGLDPVNFPLSRTMRFRDSNLETLDLVNGPDDFDGVVADERGRVLAMWSSFAWNSGQNLEQENKGLPADLVAEAVALARGDRVLRSLELELAQIPLSSARSFGLSDDWVSRLEAHDEDRRQALQVVRVVAGSPAEGRVLPGDILLSVDGELVTRFREVELAAQVPEAAVTLLRDGDVFETSLPTAELGGLGLDRMLVWAGAFLQKPHRAMSAQRGVPPEGIFVAYFNYGSPASRHGLYAGRRIVEVDGEPTPDLDTFLSAVGGREDRSSVRLKTVNWNGQVEVITLKLDKRYWPAYELRREGLEWQKIDLENGFGGASS